MSHLDRAVLKILARQGSATWYTIDRALAREGLHSTNVASIAHELEERGLIRVEPKREGMPAYLITDKGLKALA